MCLSCSRSQREPFNLSPLSVMLAWAVMRGLGYIVVYLFYTESVEHFFTKGCCTLSNTLSELIEMIV